MGDKQMSTIDLILLGVLMDRPMNAYEINNFIENNQLYRILKISTPAVYKYCKKLHSAGHLDSEKVREGESPEKVIYTVNSNGKKRFSDLMEHFSKEINPFFFEFNTFIWNIGKLGKKEGLEMLNNLKSELETLKKWISEHAKEVDGKIPFGSRVIVKQYHMIIVTLVKWINETIEEYKEVKK